MEGYIKIYRQLLDWEWYTDTPTKCLFIHLLLKSNIKDGNWRGIPVKKGSLITGRKKLSEDLGLTESQIRTSLEKLLSTNEIAIKTTKSFSIVELKNWDKYQETIANKVTAKSPTNRQPIATEEEGNKVISNITPISTDREFFEDEIKRVSDPALINSLREWWKYKKGKYTPEGWQKQITICLKYSPKLVCNRIDEAIASGWKGMNLSTVREETGSAPPVIHRISASS